jgi:hypothetical protein
VPYAGRPYGFDFSDTDPTAADAIGHVMRFFQARLKPAWARLMQSDHTPEKPSTTG